MRADKVIDDSSLMQLDVRGIKEEEIGNLEKCGAGKIKGQAEVDALKETPAHACDSGSWRGDLWFPHGTLLLHSLAGMAWWSVCVWIVCCFAILTEMIQSHHLLH